MHWSPEVIDPINDDLLTLSEAATLFPRRRGGARVNTSTLWRWRTRGSRGIRLETVKVGSQVCTTADAIRAFIAARSAADVATCPQAPSPSKASANAMRELERMGL